MIGTLIALYFALCSLGLILTQLHRSETQTYGRPRPIASHPFNK